VHKPSGPSSRTIVDRLIRPLGTRRVGHAGTLDPLAEGLLLVVWGRATALVPYLQAYPKSYLAGIRFGRITDTQDRTGVVLEERSTSALTADSVREALAGFRGRIRQRPPAFSAVKVGGERLYRRARAGVTAGAEVREREVHRFDLTTWGPPVGWFEIVCSSGTYVRTLAHDLGQALGPGASLDTLTRTAIGPFRLADAVPPDAGPALLAERAIPPAGALPDWPSLMVGEDEVGAVAHGSWRDPAGSLAHGTSYRILDPAGNLLALATGGSPIRILRVFAEGEW
jgi:tRNA pseudouridine55 synthase